VPLFSNCYRNGMVGNLSRANENQGLFLLYLIQAEVV
jgi:hypothetical protein